MRDIGIAIAICVLLVTGVRSVSLHFRGPGTASWTLEPDALPWAGSYQFLSGTGPKTVLLSVVDASTGSVLGQCSSISKEKDWQSFSFAITRGSLHCNVSQSNPMRIRFPLMVTTRSFIARFGSVDGADCIRDLLVSHEDPVECPPNLSINGFASESLECGCPFDASSETVASRVIELLGGSEQQQQEQEQLTTERPFVIDEVDEEPFSSIAQQVFPSKHNLVHASKTSATGVVHPPESPTDDIIDVDSSSLSSPPPSPLTPATLRSGVVRQRPVSRERGSGGGGGGDVPFPLFEMSPSPKESADSSGFTWPPTTAATVATILNRTSSKTRGTDTTREHIDEEETIEHVEPTSPAARPSTTRLALTTTLPQAPWTLPAHPCTMIVCENNGTCVVGPDGQAKCLCPHGYSGHFCELEVCATFACINGGRCHMTADGQPKCICPSATTGVHCEQTLCSAPCENDGICTLHEGAGVCQCPIGFVGANCNLRDTCADVDRCAAFGSARCQLDPMAPAIISPVLVNASYTCQCPDENNKWSECKVTPVFPPIRVVTSAPIAPPRIPTGQITSAVPPSMGRNPPGTVGTPVFPMHHFISTVNGESDPVFNVTSPSVISNAATTKATSTVSYTDPANTATTPRKLPTARPLPPTKPSITTTEETKSTVTVRTRMPSVRPESIPISQIPIVGDERPETTATGGITVEEDDQTSPAPARSTTTSPKTQKLPPPPTHHTVVEEEELSPTTPLVVPSSEVEEIPVETSDGTDHREHGHIAENTVVDEERLAGRRTAGQPDHQGSSSSSWIAVLVLILVLLVLAVVLTTFAVRYIHRSRKLHGKYNPAKEESAVHAGTSLPMTAVSKEERLI